MKKLIYIVLISLISQHVYSAGSDSSEDNKSNYYDDAKKLVNYYEAQEYKYDELFYEWLGVKKNSLDFVIKQFANKKYWTEKEPGVLTKNIKKAIKKKDLKSSRKIKFISNSTIERDKSHKYITIGKGHP